MAPASTSVLYVAGGLRSGSTVFDRVLGARTGVQSLGEMAQTWVLGVIENRRCTCGQHFSACPFWQDLSAELPTALSPSAARAIHACNLEVMPTRRLPRLLAPGRIERIVGEAPAVYRTALAELYPALTDPTGATLLVDSSKHPVYLALLAGVPGLDVRMVHLVRDPRAVAHSWRRKVLEPGAPGELYMRRLSPARSSLYWLMWNLAVERVQRSLGIRAVRVRYEDFADAPDRTIDRALEELWPAGEPSRGEPSATPQPAHVLSGNPSRFDTGPIRVRADTEWRDLLSKQAELTATAIALPLLHRYGYPVRPRRSRSR